MPNKRRIQIFISGLLMLLCGYLVYWLGEYQKYDKSFTAMAEAAVPKMADLNNQILSEIHPPLGVELIQQNNTELWSPLGTRMYFVLLVAQYKIIQTSPEEIVNHYQNLLMTHGWQASQSDLTDTTPDDFYTYYRYSTQIRFSIHTQHLEEYTLEISHDFWSQEFSPPKPNNTIAAVWCKHHYYICTAPTTLIRY